MLHRRPASPHLTPAQAARRLGVTIKALRLYESWGLVKPVRTDRGWRLYAPGDIERLSRALAFKAMGFSLSEVVGLLDADADALAAALATQEQRLIARRAAVDEALGAVRRARGGTAAARLRLAA